MAHKEAYLTLGTRALAALSRAAQSVTNAATSPWLLSWADKSSLEPSCWFFWEYPNLGAVLRGLW